MDAGGSGMKRRRTHRAAIVGAAALVLVACNALVGLDRDYAIAPGVDGGGDTHTDGTADAIVPVEDGGLIDAAPDVAPDVEVPCPNRTGPSMLRIGSYCIDSTEVTESQYAEFLAAAPGFSGPRPSACSWKNDFTPGKLNLPSCRWDPETYPHLPVTCIDWCDAYAYCRWAGKHLCGAIGGGAITWNSGADTDPKKDEWYQACSKGDGREYPYGATYDLGKCNDNESGIGELVDAGSMTGCEGAHPGLYDMVGNAFEFENSCAGDSGASDLCLLRGGSWAKSRDEFSKCSGRGVLDRRDNRYDDFGIRCCGN
jgi:formylglycine-generating enzyme